MNSKPQSGLAACAKPEARRKVNQSYEIREIGNGFIITGWIQGEFFELYREDIKSVAHFINMSIETNV